MGRFVRPTVAVLTISDGDTVTVRRRLNSGEERALFSRMYLAGTDGELKVNPFQAGVALVTAYLLDWTLTDDAGKVVPIADLSIESLGKVLDGLEPETYAEIRTAIESHDGAARVAREQEKNAKDGGKALPAISPSRSVVAGDTSGSAI